MMKTFTLKYDPSAAPKDIFDRMKRAASTRTPDLNEDQVSSDSIKALLSLGTESRIELFKLILNQKPESLYELAKMANKDLGYVSREIKILEGVGLIKLVSEVVDGRERRKPIAQYDRIVFDFSLDLKDASNQ